jgi:peptide/nickel transport system permease protein
MMNGLYELLGAKPLFLWTDLLIWLLVGVILLSVSYTRRRPHLLEPWRRVARSRMAMGSLVVLLLYVVVGLLDSVHYRPALAPSEVTQEYQGEGQQEIHYAVQARTLLDWLVGDLGQESEKSYSTPFATHLYSRERVEGEEGGVMRDFPRLVHGGAHLERVEERQGDLLQRLTVGGAEGVVLWLLLALLLGKMLTRRQRGRSALQWLSRTLRKVPTRDGETNTVPWSTVLWVTAGASILLMVAIQMGVHYHILGTDKVGQDVFYQAVKSIRTGLVIGTLTTLIMLPFAVFLGIMAGYFRGWIDDAIQYTYTTLSSIPGVLLIAAAILMIQVYIDNNAALFETTEERADLRLLFLCIILGVTSWTGLCRLLRGETLKLREMDYITAAHAFGVSHLRIITRHILPNVMHVVLISVVLDFSGLVLAEAVLSYVGVGVDPTMHSWGNMINGARLEMAREPVVWWTLFASFLFMFVMVLAANLFSDVVREAFDPRVQSRGERS